MKQFITLTLCLLATTFAKSYDNWKAEINYDESKVPQYTLPDLLTCLDGTPVTTMKQWEKKRRPEVMEYFQSQVYGRTPKQKIKVSYELVRENKNALGGKATSRQVRFTFTGNGRKQEAMLLIYVPNQCQGRLPLIMGYNFNGNQTTTDEPDILASPSLSFTAPLENAQRGFSKSRWSYDIIINRGYAIATMFCQDISPDNPELRDKGIAALFPGYTFKPQSNDEWQTIGAWAWGYSRILDYMLKQPYIDKNRIAVMGHSRLGKTALWAGAQDKRFKVVISNNSGCGGAALSKRVYGENIERITTNFPHWFCPTFKKYANNEAALPFDQHELLALVAPRHLYVCSAEEDKWADQKGEYLSAYHAGEVYKLYGMQGLKSKQMPAIHQPILEDVGYHIRAGVHDVTDYDWERYLDFCDKHFSKK